MFPEACFVYGINLVWSGLTIYNLWVGAYREFNQISAKYDLVKMWIDVEMSEFSRSW